MKQALTLAGAILLAALIVSGGQSGTLRASQATEAVLPPEIPPDTKVLEPDKPVLDSLDPKTPIHFYTFKATAGQHVRVSVEPKTGNFYTTLEILNIDLDTILGATIGETLVSGSLVVKIPEDGTYAIGVEYADATIGTPTPGQYEIMISVVKPA